MAAGRLCSCARAGEQQAAAGPIGHPGPNPSAALRRAPRPRPADLQQMQAAMQRPEMQQQMAEMESMLRNEEMQKRMAELRQDPEFQEMFAEIQKGGMGALMK